MKQPFPASTAASVGQESPAELNASGIRCKAAARYDDGRARYRRALALVRAAPVTDWNAVATLYHNLGGIEHAQGYLLEGAALARLGLAIRARPGGGNPLELAADGVALAALLEGQGNDDEAERLYLAALATYERTATADPADVAAALNNLGTPYSRQGRLERATGLLERAAVLKRAVLGREHPDLALTLNNLAVACRRRGDLARAAALYRESLGILERSLGCDHPRTLACRENASRCPADDGRSSPATIRASCWRWTRAAPPRPTSRRRWGRLAELRTLALADHSRRGPWRTVGADDPRRLPPPIVAPARHSAQGH